MTNHISHEDPRKKAGTELQSLHAKQDKMISNIGDVIVIIDSDGINRFKSANVEKWFGWRAEELVGKSTLDNVHPDDLTSAQAFIVDIMATPNKEGVVACRYRCKDGSYKWIEFRGVNLLHDPDIQGILGNYHDITARKQVEKALADSERQLSALVKQSPISYEIYRDDGVQLSVNAAYEQMWGMKAEDSVGKFNVRTDPQVETLGLKPFVDKAYSGESVKLPEFEWDPRKSGFPGRARWLSTRIYPLRDGQNAVQNIVITHEDITERKQAEERERNLQDKLADVERRQSMGVLAGGVAHDLNNILGPIVLLPGMVDEVLQDLTTATDADVAEARENLVMIEDSARRAANVIKDLKSLGQRGHIDLQPLDASQLISDYLGTTEVAALRQYFPRAKIDSRLRHKNLTISADKTDLCRILLNLLVNAVDAMPERGHVEVDAEPISLAERKLGYEPIEAGNYVVIHVRDTGEGISDDILKRMFEPFASTKKARGGRSGSGLGLSVVLSIMKDHHGYVDVERNTKKWSTTFSLYFPAVADDVQQQDDPDAKDQALPSGTEHILVVDDEKNQRFITNRYLRKLGYTVTEATGGREAVKLFASRDDGGAPQHSFDLIVLDMIMEEGFDGLDTYNEILKHCPDPKVLIASGHAETDRIRAAKGLGADWLAKPYDGKALAETVRRKLDEKS